MAKSTEARDPSTENAYQGRTPTSEVYYRISTSEFAILLFFAGLFDLLGLLAFTPGVGAIIDGIAQSIIGLIFVVNGVSLMERKFLMRFVLVTVVEFIPFVGMLPMLMAEAYTLASLSWIADKARATATKAASKVVGQRVAGVGVGLAYAGAMRRYQGAPSTAPSTGTALQANQTAKNQGGRTATQDLRNITGQNITRDGAKNFFGFKNEPTPADLKSRYRDLSKKYHPDLAKDETDKVFRNKQFKDLRNSYDLLRNADTKPETWA